MNITTLFDVEAVQAVAARYGTSPVGGTVYDFPDDAEIWDVPLYLGEEKSQDCDSYRIDVSLDTETGSWAVRPYVDNGRTYTNPEIENIIEALRQSVKIADELNAL